MKTKFIYLILLALPAFSCAKQSLQKYHGDNYIQFAIPVKDSTVFSFAYDETLSEGDVALKVTMISPLVDSERQFRVAFDQEKSSAQAGTDFEMPDELQTVAANDSIGYVTIHVKRSATLGDSERTAVFRIEESADFKPGMVDYRYARVIISGRLSRPAWWDTWHEENGLGKYTDLKFRTFIRQTGITDMTLTTDGGQMDYSTMRANVLKFKYWLLDNPTQEQDGSLMEVAMRG